MEVEARPATERLSSVQRILIFTGAYFLACNVGLFFIDSAKIIAAVWPASGIALAGLLLNPRRLWPAILTSIFIIGMAANLLNGEPFRISVGYMTANVLEPLLGALLMQAISGRSVLFSRTRDVLGLIVVALGVNACTACIGAGTAWLSGTASFREFWATWWIADGLGALLITPAIIVWVSRGNLAAADWRRNRVEFSLFVSLWLTMSWIVFHVSKEDLHIPVTPQPYLLLTLLLWPALRFGLRGVTLAVLLLAVIAVTGDFNVWQGTTRQEQLLLNQVYLMFVAITGFLLAATRLEVLSSEKAAQDNLLRLRAIGDNLPNGMVYQVVREHSGQMRFLYVSAGVEKLYGVSAVNVLSDPSTIYRQILEEDRAAVAEAERVSAANLTTFNLAVRFRLPDGKLAFRHLSSTPRRLEDGRVVWDGIETDITELKQAEQALRESEERLRRVSDNASVGLIHCNRDLRYISANRAYAEIVGLPLAQIIGRPMVEVIGAAALETIRPYIERVLRGERIVYETQVPYMVSGKRYLHVCYTPDKDANGEIKGWIASITDITDHRQAEEALRVSQQRLALATSSAHMGIWDWDIVNDKMIWDDQMLRLYGVREKPASYGVEIWDNALHPDDKVAAWQAIEAALRGEKDYNVEFRVRWPDGTVRYIKADGIVLRAASGKPIRMLGVNYDITERKELADRLRQSEKMTAIGQLAGGIAHDLNNQLSPVIGYAEMLVNRLEDDRLRRQAESILTCATRAADLARNFLAFSRKGKYLSVDVDVHTLIVETVSVLERSIDKRIAVSQVLEPRPSNVKGDPTQLQNVLLNLALNARDAMPEGGNLIFATSVIELPENAFGFTLTPGRYVEISVTDTGAGMSAETQKHLFEPFFTTKEKGTGLGLAAAYGTVKNHRGAIVARSEPGQGSTFKVYLPVVETVSVSETPNACLPHTATGNAHILVVDDEKTVSQLVADTLRDCGHKVVTCGDCEEAISYYAKSWEQIDLVILDMVMPKMNGRDVFAAMRKINPKVRTLLASGYSLDGEAQNILDSGVLGLIQKPFQLAEIEQKVAEVLQSK